MIATTTIILLLGLLAGYLLSEGRVALCILIVVIAAALGACTTAPERFTPSGSPPLVEKPDPVIPETSKRCDETRPKVPPAKIRGHARSQADDADYILRLYDHANNCEDKLEERRRIDGGLR